MKRPGSDRLASADGDNARVTRIAELATGFAIGELSEDELGELHGFLTDPATGANTARIAWSTLGTITDLRAGTGRAMQEAIRLRLREENDGGFAERVRRRLGLSRPRLQPITAPEVRHRRRRLLMPVAGLALLIGLGLGYLMLNPHVPPAVVTEVVGRASLGARVLSPGVQVDLRPSVVVPIVLSAGSHLRLVWGDGSSANITGPASILPQPAALSLVQGAITADTAAGFTVGLPDGRLIATAGARILAEVENGASTVALDRGTAALDDRQLTPGTALDAGHLDQAYQLIATQPAPNDPAVAGVGRWRLSGTLTWVSARSGLAITCDTERGDVLLALAPGRLAVADRRGRTQAAIPGPPLAERPMLLQAGGGRLRLTIGDAILYDDQVTVRGLRLSPSEGGELASSSFVTGPGR